MTVVRLRGPLKRIAGDRSEHEIEGATVGELLQALEQANPAAGGWILGERGVVRRHLNVFVDGEPGGPGTAGGGGDRGGGPPPIPRRGWGPERAPPLAPPRA